MISLVIADDEERICRLITALGEWEQLGIRVVSTAANGIEALEVITREQVDILITDIRMPGLGGMELIREVNQVSPQTRIIIISGYSNFEYAQTAIEYGVKGYLLKPINRQELNDILRRQAEEIHREKREDRILQVIREENEQAVQTARRLLTTDLLSGAAHSISAQRLRDYYHFHFPEGSSLYVLFLRRCGASVKMQDSVMRILREKSEEILSRQMEGIAEDLVTGWSGDNCVCILSCRGRRREEIRHSVRESLIRLQVAQEPLGISSLSAGVGGPEEEPSQLPEALECAQKASWEYILHGAGKVYAEDVRREVLLSGSLLDRFARDISPVLEMADAAQAAEVVSALRSEADAIAGIRGWEVQELVRQAAVMVLMRLEVPGQSRIREELFRRMDDCGNEDALFEVLRDFIAGQVERLAAERQDHSNRAVRMARQYIQQHYAQQLTLEEVADSVGLTEAYFSVLFKKETGEGFAKYLASVRLDMAKRLLRESSLPVAEVCRRVGYNDVKHFTRIFEKSSGVTPATYRKLYG